MNSLSPLLAAAGDDSVVSYGLWEDAFAGFQPRLMDCLETLRPQTVCEIGGGARPSVGLDTVQRLGLRYVVLDISREQLDLAPAGYDKRVCDISARNPYLEPGYDFMFSRMLAEHVADGAQFHRNVFQLLRPGGVALHFMPSLYATPFLANRLLPQGLSTALWQAIRRRDSAKFPARYSWCCGPTDHMRARFEDLGYEILEYRGFYGHGYYRRLPPLHGLVQRIARLLLAHPQPLLASYVWLMLRKPGGAQA
ncbi:MAG TPA: methyltransferase domain-containing protein [Solimonas sp.]|nr:methyltransferase domain-containing protein [Solimonas sp.]